MEAQHQNIALRIRQHRREALELANMVRTAQAELKRRLRQGRVNPVVLLQGHDEMWSRFAMELKIGPLLRSIPGFGREHVREILAECGMFPDDRLKNQSPEKIARLVYLIELCLERE